jgi:vacuolar iron transporter family protein
MADGLTVPFALAAGLTAAVTSSHVIVTAGLAEVAAGAIAMGLGGYLAARSDQEHYASEERRERDETEKLREIELGETADIFRSYGLEGAALEQVTRAVASDQKRWVDFMMRFELGLEEPDPKRAVRSAATIAGAYIAGGFIPLAPYVLLSHAATALPASVAITLLALMAFGYVKGRFTGAAPVRSAVQTTLIGGLAAGVAFAVARLIS